jgi:hypothetical protein
MSAPPDSDSANRRHPLCAAVAVIVEENLVLLALSGICTLGAAVPASAQLMRRRSFRFGRAWPVNRAYMARTGRIFLSIL